MDFFITCDANIESGLNELLNELYDDGFDTYFEDRLYDDSGINITIVLMCRDPELNFKQRIRFSKKENNLYMDIMLDFERMRVADATTRKRIVGEKIVNEVPQIIARYKTKGKYGFKDFDLPRFSRDLREWFEENGWIEPIFTKETDFEHRS